MAGSPDAGGVALVRSVRLAGGVVSALGPAASFGWMCGRPVAGGIPLESNGAGVSGSKLSASRSRAAGMALQPASGREWCRTSGQLAGDRSAVGRGSSPADRAGAVVLRPLGFSPAAGAAEPCHWPAGATDLLDGLVDASRLDRPCGDRREGLECLGAGCTHSRFGDERTTARRRHQFLPRPLCRHQAAA